MPFSLTRPRLDRVTLARTALSLTKKREKTHRNVSTQPRRAYVFFDNLGSRVPRWRALTGYQRHRIYINNSCLKWVHKAIQSHPINIFRTQKHEHKFRFHCRIHLKSIFALFVCKSIARQVADEARCVRERRVRDSVLHLDGEESFLARSEIPSDGSADDGIALLTYHVEKGNNNSEKKICYVLD